MIYRRSLLQHDLAAGGPDRESACGGRLLTGFRRSSAAVRRRQTAERRLGPRAKTVFAPIGVAAVSATADPGRFPDSASKLGRWVGTTSPAPRRVRQPAFQSNGNFEARREGCIRSILSIVGTAAWTNWKAFEGGSVETENFDDELQSDALFVGGPIELGPFTLSTVVRRPGDVGPALIIHGGLHADLNPSPVVAGALAKADSSAYHGGTMSDEIAALVSLLLGVRLRFAGTRRLSGIHRPGSPSAPMLLEVQRLLRPGLASRELIPRALSRRADISRSLLLHSFPTLDESSQVALVRAARAYATALWWANEDPNQAWLHLVTAVEIAAKTRQVQQAEPVSVVREIWPDLWNAMDTADEAGKIALSTLLVPLIKSTKSFIEFIVEYAPDPPELRPAWDQLDWGQLKRHASTIYDHRSKALHEGRPFPYPLLEAPRVDMSGAIQEVPSGLSTAALGAIWHAKEAPMLLSTFEYIVRDALVAWWNGLTTDRVG